MGLIIIYALSFLSLAATIVRLYMVVVYNSAEGILHGGIARLDYICWTNVEMTTAITCANLPAMSSLIRQFSRKRIKNSQAYKTTVGKLPSNFSSRWNLLHGQMLSVVRTGRKKDDSSLQQDMLEKGSNGAVVASASNSASKSNGDSNSDGFTGGYYSPTSPKKGEEEGAYSNYTTSTAASSAAPGTTDINHSASSASGNARSAKHMPIAEFRREHPEGIAYASATTTTTITTTAAAGAAGAAVASATSRDRGGGGGNGTTKEGIKKNDTSWLEPKTEIYNDDDDYDNEPLV